jgi:hypothetical protein
MMAMMIMMIKKWSGKIRTRNMYQWLILAKAIRKFLVLKRVDKLLEQALLSDHFISSRKTSVEGVRNVHR